MPEVGTAASLCNPLKCIGECVKNLRSGSKSKWHDQVDIHVAFLAQAKEMPVMWVHRDVTKCAFYIDLSELAALTQVLFTTGRTATAHMEGTAGLCIAAPNAKKRATPYPDARRSTPHDLYYTGRTFWVSWQHSLAATHLRAGFTINGCVLKLMITYLLQHPLLSLAIFCCR